MSDEKIYYLVFGESSTYYLSRWFKPGFRHVHAIARIAGYWCLVDPALRGLVVHVLGKSRGVDFIAHYSRMNPSYTILALTVGENIEMPTWRIGPISCVSTIQYLIGIYWPLTLTPYQLYSKLIAKTPSHIRIVDNEQLSREVSQESPEKRRIRSRKSKRRSPKAAG